MPTLTWSSNLRKAALATKQVEATEAIKFNTVVSNFNLSSEEKTAFFTMNKKVNDSKVASPPWN